MEYKERFVTKFYNNLEKGKIIGQKCKRCGGYQVLLSPCCRHCQSTSLEDVEFSMKGTLQYATVSYFADDVYLKCGNYPIVFGAVILDEGPVLFMRVDGVRPKAVPDLYRRCPLPVTISTEYMAGNHVPVAKLVQ
jgi:uncharacterized OB-fold protein